MTAVPAMINVNKLFPRLSIRYKLSIAFAGVALVPLLTVTIYGALSSARQLESTARLTVEHDLRLAETLTARELEASERHIAFLAQAGFAPLLRQPAGTPVDRQADVAMVQLVSTEPTLYRVRLVNADGQVLATVSSAGVDREEDRVGRGTFYAWRGEQMSPGDRALVPVELSGGGRGDSTTVAAIAILVPVFDADQEFAGVVVGEAYASRLLSGLELATPGYDGVTALVDTGGLYLYHSVRKRDWARLLTDRERIGVGSDLGPDVATMVLEDSLGAVRAADGSLVSFRRLRLGNTPHGPTLTLYRVVDSSTLTAPVRRFLQWVFVGGALVVVAVLGVAVLAGEQLTWPIRRIQENMWRLAKGEAVPVLEVASNDELEDLARDFNTVATMIQDHRDRREALLTDRTRALHVTHAELTGIVGHSADAIIGTDRNGRIRLWNAAASRLFGFSADEVMDRPVATLLSGQPDRPPDDQRFIDAELVRSGEVIDFRTTRFARDGTAIPVSLSEACVRDDDGSLLGYSLIIRDRRGQVMLDDQMRRSERLAAMSVVAASVAHEINNPLAVIVNRIELMRRDLRRDGSVERMESDLAVLLEHGRRATSVTRDLLRFAREGSSVEELVDLGAVSQHHCDLLRRTLAARGIRLDHAAAQRIPSILANQQAIESVLVNLILNAADATPTDGTVRVAVRHAAGAPHVEVLVEDSGPGVPASLRERIFEPFFTTKAEGHGTGLGLTVCRSIVERMGGKIGVDRSELGGAAFVLRFPLPKAGNAA